MPRVREISYLELAKQARLDGKNHLVWFYIRQQARLMRKQKAAAVTATK